MKNTIFFIDSYKTGMHKSLYRFCIKYFISSFLILLSILFLILRISIIISFYLIILSIIVSTLLIYMIIKYKRNYFDNYYSNNLYLNPLLGNSIVFPILIQYICLNIFPFFLTHYYYFDLTNSLIQMFILSSLILFIEILLMRKRIKNEYSVVIKYNNEFYILKVYNSNYFTNGETINFENLNIISDNVEEDENIYQLANGLINVIDKILSNKMNLKKREKNYLVYENGNSKYGIIKLNNYKINYINETFINLSYQYKNKTKRIKLINAYPHLIRELKKKSS